MQSTNTLGRYHIIRELARSNDIVYEAMDPAGGKRIALKELQIPPNLVGQQRQERIQRFTREARAAARLQHDNVVRILDHGQAQGRYYIAMEFLEGQSLRDVLRQRGALPLQEALRIAAAVADGLEYAHKNGVIHRDVKPDNVHLEPGGRVVITDFGIARLTFEPTLTADGQIFGTPSYMSPEQVTGKGIDKRSDVFSLGVMLYEMIAGRKPFTGDSVITITYNIMNMELPSLVGAPPGADQIIRRATSKEPGRRYRSAAEMAEDLRMIAQGGAPRHAAAAAPPSMPSLRPPQAAGGPNSWPAPQGRQFPPPSAPPAGQRPLPQPVYGNGRPAGGMVPGARPMPPHPGSARRPGGPTPMPAGGAGASAASYPMGMAGPPAMPAYSPAAPGPVLRARPRPRRSGSDFVWFLGWLAIAVVIGLLVLGVVWAASTSMDKFRQDSASASVRRTLSDAGQALHDGRYEDALAGYRRVAAAGSLAERGTAQKNGAVAAVELARKQLAAGTAAKAEKSARDALALNPDSASACVELGRALAAQGKIDDAVQAFDQASDAAARAAQSASPDEARSAKEAADVAPMWKADALYKDGVEHMKKDPALARRRFDAVIQVSPNSQYAKNARTQLTQMPAPGAVGGPGDAPLGNGADPDGGLPPPTGMGAPGAPAVPFGTAPPPNAPPGWDPSYRGHF